MIDLEVIHRVQTTLRERKGAAPDSSYVASLYAKGTDAICKKVAEEAAETIMAAKDGDRLHLVTGSHGPVVSQHDPAGTV
jgi:phosphoribosyl-ATP pyrophosphohydrolase